MAQATRIVLAAEEKEKLECWARSGKTEQRLAVRARVILAAAAGKGTYEICPRTQVVACSGQ